MALQIHALFPTAVATAQLTLDPLELAAQLQTLLMLRGADEGNPNSGCAWTGDLNGVWQLHRHPDFSGLTDRVVEQAWAYLSAVGFDQAKLALHVQSQLGLCSATGIRWWAVTTTPMPISVLCST